MTEQTIEILSYKNEIKKEIEEEFIEVLKNNLISPNNEGKVLFGKKFAFKYVETKRFKRVIQLIFEVYGVYETHRYYHYSTMIGKVIVSVKVRL